MNVRSAMMTGAALLSVLPLLAPAHAQTARAPDTQTERTEASGVEKAMTIVDTEANDKDAFKFDFGVPSSPALTLLGVDKDKITQSNSLKPFVFALPGLFTSKETGQAAALEVAPAWLYHRPEDRTREAYAKSGSWQFRTRVGIALYEGVNDSDPAKAKPSRAALGVSSSPLTTSDPILATFPGQKDPAWDVCYDSGRPIVQASIPLPSQSAAITALEARADVLDAELDPYVGRPDEALPEDVLKKRLDLRAVDAAIAAEWVKWEEQVAPEFARSKGAEVIETCLKVANRVARTGADLDLGGGVVWEGDAGKLSGFKHPSGVLWGSFRTSLGVAGPRQFDYASLKTWVDKQDSWLMIGAATRVGIDEAIATGDAAKPKIRANTYTGWVGLERYSEKDRFALQVGLQRTDPRLAADSGFAGTRTVYLASYDREMSNGVWLSASFGRAEGEGSLKDDATARLSVVFTAPAARKIFGD